MIYGPKNDDNGVRTEIIDEISTMSLVVIHSDEGCVTSMLYTNDIKNHMRPAEKINCVCGEWK